jgi:hypothetical protein
MKQLVNNNCKRLLGTIVERLTDDDERLTGNGDDKRLSD